jgi:hypothetical protein
MGFPQSWCLELHGSGTVVTSGTSLNVSGKSSGTYTYQHFVIYSGYWVNGTYPSGNPASVQVILPLPEITVTNQQPVGPVNAPSYYIFGWSSNNSNNCDLDFGWYNSGAQLLGSSEINGAGTSNIITVSKQFSTTAMVRVTVTCQGPGGESSIDRNLDF